MCGTCHDSFDPLFPDAELLSECLHCHEPEALPEVGEPVEGTAAVFVRVHERGPEAGRTPLGGERLEAQLRESAYTPVAAPAGCDWILEVELDWRPASRAGLYLEAEIPVLLSAETIAELRRSDGTLVLRDGPTRTLGFGRTPEAARASALRTWARGLVERLRVVTAGEELPQRSVGPQSSAAASR